MFTVISMQSEYEIRLEDIATYTAEISLDGLEIWWIYLMFQTALKDKRSRKRLGKNHSIVKKLHSKLEYDIKQIELYCKSLGE